MALLPVRLEVSRAMRDIIATRGLTPTIIFQALTIFDIFYVYVSASPTYHEDVDDNGNYMLSGLASLMIA